MALFLGSQVPLHAQNVAVPLFVIAKNTNANAVHYDAELTRDGKLDPNQPVVAYWIMAAENGRRQELNFLERSRAYGFTLRPDGPPDSYVLSVVSEKKKEIRVYADQGTVRAEASIGGHRAYLQKIFITEKKTLGVYLPEYAEMFGVDVDTGQPCYEKVAKSER